MKTIPIVLSVCLAAALTAAAQDDVIQRPAVRMPVPTRNAASTAAQAHALPESLEMKNVLDVLADYGRLIGKKIVYDNTMQGSITIDRTISEEKAADLTERTLFLNGFSLVDVSEDAVAVLGLGKPVRDYGVPLYAKPEELPKAERVVSYLFKLQHRDPQAIQAFLQQYIPSNNACGFYADAQSQTLVATGQTSVIRTVIRLIAALDVPPVSDKDAPPRPDRKPRENPPAPPKHLKPPQPIPSESDDQ